jgi:hypothetical protein
MRISKNLGVRKLQRCIYRRNFITNFIALWLRISSALGAPGLASLTWMKPNYNLTRTAVQGKFTETWRLRGSFLRLATQYSRRFRAWNLKHVFGMRAAALRSFFDACVQEPLANAR